MHPDEEEDPFEKAMAEQLIPVALTQVAFNGLKIKPEIHEHTPLNAIELAVALTTAEQLRSH
jgi:hypothetical protein